MTNSSSFSAYPETRADVKATVNLEDEQDDSVPAKSRSTSVEGDDQEAAGSKGIGGPNRPVLHQRQSDSIALSPSTSTDVSSAPTSAGLDRPRTFSSTSLGGANDRASLSHLPEDLQFYLEYHRQEIGCQHYLFKHDADAFLQNDLFNMALEYKPLLYAVVGFAAYHVTLNRSEGMIQDFLGYYDRSVSSLRRSLASGQRHTIAMLLTILQLATFEGYLGDYVSLLVHQQAAHRMLLEFYSPVTIMNDDLGRTILSWYTTFDLTGALMSEHETALSGDWFLASERYYRQRELEESEDIQPKIDATIATHRRMCGELAQFFSKFKNMTDEEVDMNSKMYREMLDSWYTRLHPTLKDDRYLVTPATPADTTLPTRSGPDRAISLWEGPLYPFNFMYLDWLAVMMMLKYKLALRLNQPMPAELEDHALDAAVRIEGIEQWHASPNGCLIRTQACVGMASLFLPKDEQHTLWCRTKLARIESLGHVYPQAFRQQLASLWGLPEVNHWWLPDQHPAVIQSIRSCVEQRLPMAAGKARNEDQLNIKGIFANLSVNDEALQSIAAGAAGPAYPKSGAGPSSRTPDKGRRR